MVSGMRSNSIDRAFIIVILMTLVAIICAIPTA